MSKGNMLLGHARGKVGSLVFSRSNGQQVVRAKSDVVANPQTRAQMIQRILLNTIAQAYSKMSAICDHSFQGIKTGQDSMSYFLKVNLKNLRNRVAQEIASGYFMDEIYSMSPIGSSVFVPNDYVIAKGKLPKITPAQGDSDQYMAMTLADNTYQGVCDQYGLQRGDQLTFVGVQGADADNLSFAFARVILDPRDENDQQLPMSTAFIGADGIEAPNKRNEGEFVTLAFDTDHVNFGFAGTYAYTMSSAIIVSRKGEDDSWQRSDATLVAKELSAEKVYSLGYALELLETGGIGTESSRYLNNAGRNRTAEISGVHESRIAQATVGGSSLSRGGTANVAPGSSIAFSGTVNNPSDGLKVGLVSTSAPSSVGIDLGSVGNDGAFSGSSSVAAGTYKLVLYTGESSAPEIVDEYATVVSSGLPGQ